MISALCLFLLIIYTPETVPTTAGTYPVSISQEDENGTVEGQFYLTVTQEHTVIENNLAIDAKDFIISKTTNLNNELIIKMSKAKVWNIQTLEEYDINRVEIAQINDDTYHATLYSFQDINTTISITLVDDYYSYLEVGETEYEITIVNEYFIHIIIYALLVIFMYSSFILLMRRYNKTLSKEVGKIMNIKRDVKEN